MPSTLLRFVLMLALLLVGRVAVHAQSAPVSAPVLAQASRTVTGFGDPEPMDPRCASAAEVAELKTQMNTLVQAYQQLVSRYNEQNGRLQELERTQVTAPQTTTTSASSRNRTFRIGSY